MKRLAFRYAIFVRTFEYISKSNGYYAFKPRRNSLQKILKSKKSIKEKSRAF